MSSLSGNAKIAGVIGWPVAHSLSPRLHGYWLQTLGIDGAYVPLPVAPENISDALRALPKLGFAGANVTVPHKEAALAAVDEVSEIANRIGAVNTLICKSDGTLYGDNTDAFGFIENLRAGAPSWRPDSGCALVLGAGGAARAVITALIDAGVTEISLSNRTLARADDVAQYIGGNVAVVPWEARDTAAEGVTLLVNTTTLGMTGKAPLEMDIRALADDAVVTDIVYAPLQTPLLASAHARGLTTVDGLGMLLHQARPGFEAWFGVRPEVTADLRRHVLESLG
jgi:shikimate dehydrogenase